MKKVSVVIVAVAAVVTGWLAAPAAATHNDSVHSDNMSLITNWNNNGEYGSGSDEAFWGTRAIFGAYSGPGGFRMMDISNPAAPKLIAPFDCAGTQADVSIWRDLAIVSVDAPRGGTDEDGQPIDPKECGAAAANQAEIEAGTAWEGLRIVSLANPSKPVQIAALATPCGSHTHTMVPDEARNRLFVYVQSYPLGAPYPTCNVASHRKVSIVEIPLTAPANAKVVGAVDVSPNIGCHEVTVFLPRMLAAAACISESQMWDIKDPANPKVIAHIPNPNNNIHHSSSFAWDGNTLVLGDELGGAAAAPGCIGSQNGQLGGLWFYDVSDPTNPEEKGFYRIPQQEASELCTAHLFNVIPLRSEKDILVASWYHGGTTVVDFTDPTKPQQIAFYIPKDPVAGQEENAEANYWASYWYNGHVYGNNYSPRGIDVFTISHPDLASAIKLDRMNPQVQEPLPPPPATSGANTAIQLPAPSTARCTPRRGFRLRLRAPRRQKLRSAVVYVGGRRAKVVRGKALRRPVKLRGLRKGRVRIDVTLRTRKGRTINRSRTYRFC